MSVSQTEKKIIWAVDPFSRDKAALKSAAWSIRGLIKGELANVQPVHVWQQTVYETMPDPESLERVQREGQEEIERMITRIKVPGIQSLQVLSKPGSSVRKEAQDLIGYAKERGADLIVVSSHGRKGIKRWFLGSFAETLSLYSDVPLLIVHPNWRRTPDFKTVLFPTDFSAESLEAFRRVLDFAAVHKSRITLFHKAPTVGYAIYDLAFISYAYYEKANEAELAANEKLAKKLVQQGKERGVQVKVVVDRSRKYSVAESILNRAKRSGAMIAMASHSGPLATVLMGSTTRQVVRYSDQPVWVIHPRAKKAGREQRVEPLTTVTREDIESDLFEHGRNRSA